MLHGFKLETLTMAHDRERFQCASESLNEFIKKRARHQHDNQTTRVYVYVDDHGTIAGFFTLSALSVSIIGLPETFTKGRSKLDVPATLLGRFAVDNQFAGKGLGKWLLVESLKAAYNASKSVGSALVALDVGHDASPEARHLYAKIGFVALTSNAERMVLPMSDISRIIKP